ncbi:MAG: hypothetical protein JRF49_01770 [Deltaproteobacteria bacterium]|nr:hypothetical protein [Deltaproteobacteria bacterium]
MLTISNLIKWIQSIAGRDRRVALLQTLSSAVLAAIFSVSFSGCVHTKTDVAGVIRKGNHDPVLVPLTAEVKGKRMRIVSPGTTVMVHAHASDVDGDRLRYRWIVAPNSGKVETVKASSVKWNVGKGKDDKRLYVVVVDGKGGSAKGELRLPTRSEVVFSGQVLSTKGKAIKAAHVDVNGETTVTDSEGFFKLPIKKANAPRFVLNITKQGFGLVSRVYDQGVQGSKWTMTEATTQTFNPTQAIVIRDVLSQTNCTGSLTNGINWNNYPQQRIPRIIDTFGQLSSGTIPNEITQALNIIFGGTDCNPGISITIPPNSLVDTAGNSASDKIEVSVSTVDLYAPDSMPGDYTVRTKEGTRWMQSYGAGTVNIQSGEKSFQLKKNAYAKLTIPVDPTQLKMKGKIPPTMPLLLYDDKNGEWTLKGKAKLNKEGTAYIARVNHLSAYNTDLIKTDQACIRFIGDNLISTDGTSGKYKLSAIIPMGTAAPVVRSWDITPSTESDPHLHTIVNLPSNTWITLIPMREESGGLVPYGIFGINSGPDQNPTDPNFPPYPYTACQNEVELTDVGGALDIIVDGTGHITGPLPAHFYALTNPDGTDIYPLAPISGAYSLYGLYDSGSTKVRINDLNPPNRISGPNFGDKDTGILGLTSVQTVNLRLNGLNARLPSGGIPMGEPGSANPAQVQVNGIAVKPDNVDATLIGAPVINQVVAHIDYTTTITDSPGFGITVTGPYTDFFLPGDPGIPAPDLILQLERFGNLVSTDGATPGQRYWLRNVVFQNGNNVVADHQNAPNPFDFLFDTGTTLTIVNNRTANSLGLSSGSGTFNCFGGTSNGYVIDSVTMIGSDGSYRINNANICWQESAIGNPQIVDAVIGSNFFDQVQIIFDGPGDNLGIKQ